MALKVNIFINYKGNCQEAFDFYSEVFNTPLDSYKVTYGQDENMKALVKEEDKDKIFFCALPVANETMIFGGDVVEGLGFPSVVEGNNVTVMFAPNTEDETKRLFAALSEGGIIRMPLERTSWESLHGECTDKFGINWAVDFSYDDTIEAPNYEI